MDSLNQMGKGLRKTSKTSEHSTRRVAENFPYLERKADQVIFDKPFKMEFNLTDHPHSVFLNLYLRPPSSCFRCNILYASPTILQCVTTGGGFGTDDGLPHPGVYSGFSTNIGGFTMDADGIIVPKDGLYTIEFIANVAGVTISESAGIIATVRHNGVVKSQQVDSVANGRLNPPVSFISQGYDMYGLCIPCREGDTLNGWLAGGGISFYTPTGNVSIKRVGLL